jgi:hypothetical protein
VGCKHYAVLLENGRLKVTQDIVSQMGAMVARTSDVGDAHKLLPKAIVGFQFRQLGTYSVIVVRVRFELA